MKVRKSSPPLSLACNDGVNIETILAVGMPRDKESDGIRAPVLHYGNNYGACNVVYGGTQVISGATMYFGT
jgi:hypothetical protein